MDHKAYDSREAFEAELADIISRYDPAVIVLAGFMRVLTEGLSPGSRGRSQHSSRLVAAFPRPQYAPARHRCGLPRARLDRSLRDGRA